MNSSPALLPAKTRLSSSQVRAIAELELRRRSGLGDDGAPAESELVSTARAVLLGQQGIDDFERVPPQILPLYTPKSGGTWHYCGEAYSAAHARAWIAREVERCRDLTYFCLHYAYTQNMHFESENGEPDSELIPDWPVTRATLAALDPPQDTLIEKSRDMMVSWICMATVLHDLLFRREWPVMTLSRVEDLVDQRAGATTATLHGKVKYIYERLPPFLRDATPLLFATLRIQNEATGAYVLGFSATGDAGRAPKWKRAILDEFASVPNSEEVLMSVGPACPRGKVLVSTPKGKSNAFYRIRQGARIVWPPLEQKREWTALTEHCDSQIAKQNPAGHWARLSVHWTQHPSRDATWFDSESSNMTAEAVAQELNIGYERSLVGRVYPKFSYDRHVSGAAFCEASTDYDPGRPLYLCMDFNHDPLIWEIVQPHSAKPVFRVIGEICRRNANYEDAWNEFIVRFASRQRVNYLLSRHPEWERLYGAKGMCQAGEQGHVNDVIIFGDATEEKSSLHSRVKPYAMIVAALRDANFTVKMSVPVVNPPVITRHETVNDVLSKDFLAIDPSAEQLIKDCESGVWNGQQTDMDQHKKDDDGSLLTRSHASSGLGYMLVIKHKVASSADRARTVARAQNISAMVKRW